MDIFKTQKINALASELKKHNFADSSEDAFQQAEQVLKESPVQQAAVEEKPVSSVSSDHLAETKLKLMLDMNNKKYSQEISLLRSALGTLAQEVEGLKSQLVKLSEQVPKEKQVPLKTEPKVPHPRQGNVTPDDVDLRKMFYFGNKK